MIKKLIISAILFSLFPSAVLSADWTFLASSENGKSYYYDRESLKDQGDKVTFVTRIVFAYPEEHSRGKVKVAEDEWLMDCRNRTFQLTFSREYDEEEKEIYSLNAGTFQEPEVIAPGSFTETIYQNVCR